MLIRPEPFDIEAFAPYGECFALRDLEGDRHDFAAQLTNGRSHARLNVSISRSKPQTSAIRVAALERHDHSAQAFAPIVVSRWLVAIAPNTTEGGPDFSQLRAFVMDENLGICYRPNVWHHPFACFDTPAEMLMLRWDDQTESDTTWAKTPSGSEVQISLP